MDISQYDLEYLRPPPEASFLNHDTEYIKSGSGKTAKRKIFYNTPFDTSELQAVHELESLLQKQGVNLPPQWNKSETLKYLYSAKFDLNMGAKLIRSCLQWRSESRSYLVTAPVKQYYDTGIIYPWGIDYHFRPIMIINLNKLKTAQVDEGSFDAALAIMMDILRSYCFIPRKIENWVIIVDAQNVKNFDPAKIKPLVYLTKSCFPSSLEKLFVISSPSSFEKHWDTIQETAGGDLPEEVILLSNTDLFKLQTFIPPDSLEKKYGGVCPDVEKYWPPPARHITKRGSVTNMSVYSDPNDSNFLNESFRSESGKKFNVDESAIPASNYPTTKLLNQPVQQNQPKVQNQQRHTVSGAVPNDLGGSNGSRNEFERRSQNEFPSLPQVPSTGAIKEEEFIRNLIYAKSPSRSAAHQMKPESQNSLHNSVQGANGLPGHRKSAQSGYPHVQSGHLDDDVMSVRSASSTGSRRNKNANMPELYERTLVDQVNNPSRTRITEPDVPIVHEGNMHSFQGDVQRTSSRNSLSGNYERPFASPEKAKKTVNAGVPQEYQSLNNSTRSPFVEGGNYRDTMESPPRKSTELSVQRGDTIHIEGSWRNMEERSTKKNPYDSGPQEFRRQLIENSANNSDDDDDGDRFCGLCIRSKPTKKKQQPVKINGNQGRNVYEY